MGGIDVATLVERGRLVRFPVEIRVFEDQDPVPLLTFRHVAVAEPPVVDDLADPDASLVVDLDVGRVHHQRLGGKERARELGIHFQLGDGIGRFVAANR